MNRPRKGGLGRGLDALISSTGSKPISRPSDVFFPEAEGEGTHAAIPRGGSARDLLLPGGGKGAKRRGQSAEANQADAGTNVSRETTAKGSGAGSSRKGEAKAKRGNVSRETKRSALSVLTREDVSRETTSNNVVADAKAAGISATLSEIELDSIHPNAKQPRLVFDEDDLQELAHSIKEVGVLQPIVVRPDGDQFELIMGERRWRASKLAGRKTVPAIIRWTEDDDMLRDALLENLHRAQLNPLEEAAAYQQLLEDFGCSQAELAKRIARSRPVITNTMRLLQLPTKVQNQIAAGVLSAGHARALLTLTDTSDMEFLADRIISEGLSVRSTEEIVSLGDIHAAPVKTKSKGAKRVKEAPTAYEQNMANSLSDLLETRVSVAVGAKRGKITVEFADEEDLERIVALIKGAQQKGV